MSRQRKILDTQMAGRIACVPLRSVDEDRTERDSFGGTRTCIIYPERRSKPSRPIFGPSAACDPLPPLPSRHTSTISWTEFSKCLRRVSTCVTKAPGGADAILDSMSSETSKTRELRAEKSMALFCSCLQHNTSVFNYRKGK